MVFNVLLKANKLGYEFNIMLNLKEEQNNKTFIFECQDLQLNCNCQNLKSPYSPNFITFFFHFIQ